MGEHLGKFTFPMVVNEPQNVFQKHSTSEMIKNSVEQMTSLAKFDESSFKMYLALSPVIFTTNESTPQDMALLDRLECFRVYI